MSRFPELSTGSSLTVGNRRLAIEKRIGNGAFGVVYKVRDQGNEQTYALKDIPCENPSAIRKAIREVETLCKVNHSNVVKIVGADEYNYRGYRHVLILTEFCSGGNLNERLTRRSSHETNLKWMMQLASALSHLHGQSIVHRDLKPDNVLLTNPMTEDVKIGDFGLAREYLALKREWIGDWLSTYTEYYLNSGTGPIHWMAPEVFERHYTEKADVFSLGGVFYAILERGYSSLGGKRYYGAFVSIRGQNIGLGYAMATMDRDVRVKFSATSRSLREIMLGALQYSPRDRPTAQSICDSITATRSAVRLTDQQGGQAHQTQGWCC